MAGRERQSKPTNRFGDGGDHIAAAVSFTLQPFGLALVHVRVVPAHPNMTPTFNVGLHVCNVCMCGWLDSRVVSAEGPGSNHSRDAVG